MKKYLQVIKSTIDEVTTYRFNFVMWRSRNVLQLLTIYYLWITVTPATGGIFGYSKSAILTYILGASLLSSIVISSRTHEIGENINKGELSIFLAKPWNYFGYWFARDLGDKAFNIGFSIVELLILFFLLSPQIFIQENISMIFLTFLAIILGIFINFFIGCLLGMVGFWSNDVWAPRFIFYILVGFLAGSVFPLDIFPSWVQAFFQFSPFTYLIYFPLKIYLGSLSIQQIVSGFVIAFLWMGLLQLITVAVWKKGLRAYSSYGG